MRSGCGEFGPPSMVQGWLRSFAPLPENVLLLSGYWPVVGPALALATREGRIAVIVPEDERDLAEAGWAVNIRTFRPSSLDAIRRIDEIVSEPLGRLVRELDLRRGPVGYEGGPASEPATYVGMRCSAPFSRRS